MIIGYHAPLPPAPTGVADYAAALLAALNRDAEVRVNADEADVHLYQLGNNHLHAAIHDRALRNPGVVLLHDANLHHFYLGQLDAEAYMREFVAQYGAWHEATARQLWQERGLSAADARYFRFPLLANVVSKARAVIVHNQAAADEVRRHDRRSGARADAVPVAVIPHLMAPAPEPRQREIEALRQHHRILPSETVFGVFGHLRPSKRVAPILRAFAAARARRQKGAALRLVIAGEAVSRCWDDSFDWQQLEGEGVIRLGFLEGETFWDWAHLVDACLSLRYPSSAETSGIALRLMAAAKPVVVTEGNEWQQVPEGAVVPVPAGPGEQEALTWWMLELTARRSWRQGIGQRAKQHIEQEHAPATVAQRILKLLEQVSSSVS